MMRNSYTVRYLLPVAFWMLVIFISSSIPQDAFPQVEFWGWAKLIHLIYYGMLCLLCQRALSAQTRYPALARHSYLLGVLFAILYGASDEYHQLSTPGRHGQVTDVLIDGFGALLCIGGLRAYRLLRPRPAGEKSGG
ncbi:MAG TPA: VanZ family protein [Bacteroidota bacterium]|nr:VanZ family protein [Bacteroidota bacterium]